MAALLRVVVRMLITVPVMSVFFIRASASEHWVRFLVVRILERDLFPLIT